MDFPKVGMRTIKTVIAVILTLIVSEIFGLNSPILASIAAVMIMEGSVSESLSSGKNRMYGTIIGGAIGLVILYIGPGNFLFIGIGLVLIINICNRLKIEDAARMAMVVFLVIVLDYTEVDAFNYAINRTFDTLVGVVISIAVNYIIRPPRIERKIKRLLDDMYLEVQYLVKKLAWEEHFGSLDNLRKQINMMEENYEVYMDDIKLQTRLENHISSYQKLFNHFEKIRNHLSAIKYIKEHPHINEKNQEFLERYFNKKLPRQDNTETDDLDFIYNFHLEEVLNRFEAIEKILEEDIDIEEGISKK